MPIDGHIHTYARGLVRYDAGRHRVWVRGQRLHHGLTGLFLAGAGLALMAHDWRDRSIWFERGTQG
jgi:hypothetical protein